MITYVSVVVKCRGNISSSIFSSYFKLGYLFWTKVYSKAYHQFGEFALFLVRSSPLLYLEQKLDKSPDEWHSPAEWHSPNGQCQPNQMNERQPPPGNALYYSPGMFHSSVHSQCTSQLAEREMERGEDRNFSYKVILTRKICSAGSGTKPRT